MNGKVLEQITGPRDGEGADAAALSGLQSRQDTYGWLIVADIHQGLCRIWIFELIGRVCLQCDGDEFGWLGDGIVQQRQGQRSRCTSSVDRDGSVQCAIVRSGCRGSACAI